MCASWWSVDCEVAGRTPPEEVFVEKFNGVIELEVGRERRGQGHRRNGGRTARAFRALLSAASIKRPPALHARDHRVRTDRSKGPETTMGEEFITLARVVKTQGRRGEVAAETHSDIAGTLRRRNEIIRARQRQARCPPRTGSRRDLAAIRACWFSSSSGR